jgi:hypothetical protein
VLEFRPPRFRVTRPIPLWVGGAQVIVPPGRTGVVVGEYDGSGPRIPVRNRAVVQFDDGPSGEWDVSRDSIWIDEPDAF